MSAHRVAQVAAPGGRLEIVERETPQPGPGHVRIAVEACGVCHSDVLFMNALVPGVEFPVVPGHEIAGRIDEVGEGTFSGWQVGDRVAVGWFGGSCGHCTPCRSGDFIVCENLKVPGWAYDGGYAETVIAPADALVRIPDALAASDAAPLACAGVTTFNGLRRSSARPGDLVAVLGVGGLGHLGSVVWIIGRTRGRSPRCEVRRGRWLRSSRSGWRCSPLLESVDASLDGVALFVGLAVEGRRPAAPAAPSQSVPTLIRRDGDHRFDAALAQVVTDRA